MKVSAETSIFTSGSGRHFQCHKAVVSCIRKIWWCSSSLLSFYLCSVFFFRFIVLHSCLSQRITYLTLGIRWEWWYCEVLSKPSFKEWNIHWSIKNLSEVISFLSAVAFWDQLFKNLQCIVEMFPFISLLWSYRWRKCLIVKYYSTLFASLVWIPRVDQVEFHSELYPVIFILLGLR